MSTDCGGPRDKMRLCPSCRSEISVLAVKCRFCGEDVGRPRDEARQLGVDDLGGETATRYAPSGNVQEAIESFRAEEMSVLEARDEQPERKWQFRRRAKQVDQADQESDSSISSDGLQEVDQRSEALASLSIPRQRKRVSPPPKPGWQKASFRIGAFVAAAIILYFGGGYAVAIIKDYIARRDYVEPIKYINRADDILKAGGTKIQALKASLEAERLDDSYENRKKSQELRTQLIEQIENALNAHPWNRDYLVTASTLAYNAAFVDNSAPVQKLKEEVDEESRLYSVTCTRIDKDGEWAEFKLTGEQQPIVKRIGQFLEGRFRIVRIEYRERAQRGRDEKELAGGYVVAEDQYRVTMDGRPRRLQIPYGGLVQPME